MEMSFGKLDYFLMKMNLKEVRTEIEEAKSLLEESNQHSIAFDTCVEEIKNDIIEIEEVLYTFVKEDKEEVKEVVVISQEHIHSEEAIFSKILDEISELESLLSNSTFSEDSSIFSEEDSLNSIKSFSEDDSFSSIYDDSVEILSQASDFPERIISFISDNIGIPIISFFSNPLASEPTNKIELPQVQRKSERLMKKNNAPQVQEPVEKAKRIPKVKKEKESIPTRRSARIMEKNKKM
jgi:hypothetical protein